MKRVGFLLGGFQNNGGIGRVTSILANALSERDDVVVTTISYCQTKRPMLYSLSEKIHSYALLSAPTSMVKAILTKHLIKKIRTILQKENLDVLVAAGSLYYPIAIQAVRGTKTKCYCWEHTNPATVSDHKFQGWCRKYAVANTDKMIVLTRSAEEFYRDKLNMRNDKLLQIYNPINSTHSNQPYDENSKRIIAVGRLAYPKNFDRLIRLASSFLPSHPDWCIDIYGNGEERQSLLQLIEQLNLNGRINLMGQVNNLYERYSEYSFLVMTSRYEGFPMSLLEGATHRLPLVSFDIPTGPNEIIVDGENGFLVDKEDDQQMIACIEQLMENADLRKTMSENAYRMIQAFSLNDIIEQWCEIL